MKKAEISAALQQHARDRLSPTSPERALVSAVYEAIQSALSAANCLQIGSFPRFTAVTPLHDLDVLYLLGPWDVKAHDPSTALAALEQKLRTEFKNPTQWAVEIGRQTHSVTLQFKQGNEERFSVDVVPAYASGKNEFGQDTYFVPEILRLGHRTRLQEYQVIAKAHRDMQWIKTDPRGYIEVARRTNDKNPDFRKTVKLIKVWHYSGKDAFGSKLKSFHIEQIVTSYFQQDGMDMFDAVFRFFTELPDTLRAPRIRDRADPTRYIDEYISGLGYPEKRNLTEARDGFLIKLEEFAVGQPVSDLVTAVQRERRSKTEAYLFDYGIPVFAQHPLAITATAQPRDGGFRAYILDKLGLIEVDRKIQFRVTAPVPGADMYKWKVKNDDSSPEPRGEITDNQTLYDPESTKYDGNHYVECYAIRDGTCIAKARQPVTLRKKWG